MGIKMLYKLVKAFWKFIDNTKGFNTDFYISWAMTLNSYSKSIIF